MPRSNKKNIKKHNPTSKYGNIFPNSLSKFPPPNKNRSQKRLIVIIIFLHFHISMFICNGTRACTCQTPWAWKAMPLKRPAKIRPPRNYASSNFCIHKWQNSCLHPFSRHFWVLLIRHFSYFTPPPLSRRSL